MTEQAILAHSSIDGFWTPERVTELRGLFDAGLSNNQIAVKMEIRSRNSIIGKLHRLGLKRETTAGEGLSRTSSTRVTKRVKEIKQSRAPTMAPMLETDCLADLPVDICPHRISLLSASADQCKWPAADDGSAILVCGDPVFSGSWCHRHAVIVYLRPVGFINPRRVSETLAEIAEG